MSFFAKMFIFIAIASASLCAYAAKDYTDIDNLHASEISKMSASELKELFKFIVIEDLNTFPTQVPPSIDRGYQLSSTYAIVKSIFASYVEFVSLKLE